MNAVIDQGNSTCKIAFFGNDGEISEIFSEKTLNVAFLKKVMDRYRPDACILSSVTFTSPDVIDFLNNTIPYFCILDSSTPIPIANAYDSPETLGSDRIAAAVGAWFLQPGKPILIVDMGTAITYDFIRADGTFMGGNITPGINLRLKALHEFTGRLPEIEAKKEFEDFGTDTESAIRAGVMQGILYETEGYLRHYGAMFPNLFAFLTGGDLFYFAEKLKNGIFVSRNLVLNGLNRILEYNVRK